jgi:L-alanine-DL-glutamate epimerase-like enolase superfamily enzyme
MEESLRADVWMLTVPTDFRIARSRIRYSHHVLVRITAQDEVGWGAAPLYARAPHELRGVVADAVPRALAGADDDLEEARARAAAALAAFPDVLSAVDGALWDLSGRRAGRSVASLLGASTRRVPITEQLFVVSPERGRRELAAIRARGVSNVKVKLSGDADADLRLVAALRDAGGDDLGLRVDANRAYPLPRAIALAPRLRELGVVRWEEPIGGSFAAVAQLRSATPLEVILDESIRTRADLEQALSAGALDVLNLKLGRVGGITSGERLRSECASAGVAVSIGCAEDLGPAMAAILHAAAAWSPVETEGVGWMRLGVDVAEPSPEVSGGEVELADAPGWGIEVRPEAVAFALVHEREWTRRFVARSWARRQEQRVANLAARVGLLARG